MANALNARPASSAPSSSCLPAISASDILRELDGTDQNLATLSTGLQALDNLLCGGLERGKTTELWGPVGVGKTAVAFVRLLELTVAVEATSRHQTVVWAGIACGSPLSSHRLRMALPQASLKYFHSTSPPTLTHLLALIQHSADHQMFSSSGLLVIDDLNALIDFDYPRQHAYATSSESDARKWQAGRRSLVLASIVSALNKLANMHRLAIVVINGCATSMRYGIGAGPVIVPAVGGIEWDTGIWNRMVVFRDFNGRFIAVQKAQGSKTADRVHSSPVLRFVLSELSLLAEDNSASMSSASLFQATASLAIPKKRTFEEIADSEDDDEYGWEYFGESNVLPDKAQDVT